VGVAFIVIGLLIIAAALVGLFVCRRRRLLFWSQHARGSKRTPDLELNADGPVDAPADHDLRLEIEPHSTIASVPDDASVDSEAAKAVV
jgi:hypothetical protein